MPNTQVDAQSFIDYATQDKFLGTRYVDHATVPKWGPGSGWDCSSFTSYVMKKYGVSLPAYSDSQYQMGSPVESSDLQPGDLVFFHPPGSNAAGKKTGHVGIYIGDGKMVNAANPSSGTRIQPVTWDTYVGARRFIAVTGAGKAPPPKGGTPVVSDNEPAGDSPQMDKLSKKDLAESQSISWDFVKAHPDVMKVFQQAIDGEWNLSNDVGKRNFTNALQQTSWFQDNSKYAQQYLFLKDQGGENFNEQIRAAQEYVRQTAQKMGAKQLDPEQLKFFAEQTLMNGWNVDGRSSFLPQALSGQLSWTGQDGASHTFQTDFINYDAGGPAATMQTLKNVAWQNGVTYDDSYFRGAAKAVASGLGSIDDYVAEIRKSASSRSPWWKNQIDAGANARDLASPYIDVYTKLRGVDPSSVSLEDPNVKLAFNKTDPKTGTVAPMGLWDYEKALRQQDWYEYTADAHDRVGKYVSTIGKMFGFL